MPAPSRPSAIVIADSIHPSTGQRVTTLEVTFHRFVLAEFNTHRVFSRNSASSRAIPFEKQVAAVLEDPAIPVSFPGHKSGMQGGEPLMGTALTKAVKDWVEASRCATEHATTLHEAGVHKSVTNRILEPFLWHKTIVTSTEWEGFFQQRVSVLAQPEIHAVAKAMLRTLAASSPAFLTLDPDTPSGWHLPYLTRRDFKEAAERSSHPSAHSFPLTPTQYLQRLSAARCARVSYLTHDGVREPSKDLELYDRLVTASPAHWSPLEHVCRPLHPEEIPAGNLQGFRQLRHDPLAGGDISPYALMPTPLPRWKV